jgi:hypothetical protein
MGLAEITDRGQIVLSRQQMNQIKYFVVCISDFAERFNMDAKSAFSFLSEYGGMEFLMQHYDIEHTLSLDDAIDDLARICNANGGMISS